MLSKLSWEFVPLGTVAQVSAGDPAPQGNDSFAPDGVPFVRMQDVGRHGKTTCLTDIKDRVTAKVAVRLKKFTAGSILLPKSGASIRLNHRAILGVDAHVVSHLAVIETGPRLRNRFAYYWLCTRDLSTVAHDAHLPSMKTSSLAALLVPVPPLAEQDRIVCLLDAAEDLRRLRAEADRRTADLIPAIFYEIFGDARAQYKVMPLSEIVEEFRYGTSNKSFPSGKPALRIPNVIGNSIDLTDLKFVPVSDIDFERLRLRSGDVLFVRTNGNPEYIGRSAVFDSSLVQKSGFDPGEFIYASYLIRARPKTNCIDPNFLQHYLSSADGRMEVRKRARTSAGQYNINTERLGAIPIPMPPLALQRQFAARVAEVRALEAQQAVSRQRLDDLFQSMLHRAFRGEL